MAWHYTERQVNQRSSSQLLPPSLPLINPSFFLLPAPSRASLLMNDSYFIAKTEGAI